MYFATGSTCDITQISATLDSAGTSRTFNTYVTPRKPISKDASAATSLTFESGQLYHKGQPVPAINIKDALEKFLQFLSECKSSSCKCVLVAHNCKTFDSKILVFHLKQLNLIDAFIDICDGFCDSLLTFKQEYPDRRKQKLSYSQVSLCSDLLNFTYDAHNSEADVSALQKLCALLDRAQLLQCSFSVDFVRQSILYNAEKKTNVQSFSSLVENKIVSSAIAGKMAGSGLVLAHVELAFARDKESGVHDLFVESVQSKPRVTKSKAIITKVNQYLHSRVNDE